MLNEIKTKMTDSVRDSFKKSKLLSLKRKIDRSVIVYHNYVTRVNDKSQLLDGSVDNYKENDSWKYCPGCRVVEFRMLLENSDGNEVGISLIYVIFTVDPMFQFINKM